MDSENTTLVCEVIARLVRPFLTTDDIVLISRMEAGDDIEFSAETSARIVDMDGHVRRFLSSDEALPMLDAYNEGMEELKSNAENSEDDESEAGGNERATFQNWQAIRDRQQIIASELAKLVGMHPDSPHASSTQFAQKKRNIVARNLKALLLEEKRKKR